MKILMIEPYYGGSHKAFIDGLSAVSRHEWTVLTLLAVSGELIIDECLMHLRFDLIGSWCNEMIRDKFWST